MKKMLGIDYGSKRIGIAISDDEGKIAFPKVILNNDEKLFQNIEKIIMEEKISGIVLGESLNYLGEKNEIMKDIEKFKTKLEEGLNLPVYFEQEFMTSMQARRTMKQSNNETVKLDDSAAAIILQSYLDKE
ncbi:MAG: putative holliday junction resolvase [Parcubacteria group bacterium Athens0714_16]|nr:MAG: putative holliday junction resolvase [Parcubacteria group bacterium Athens0714_16]